MRKLFLLSVVTFFVGTSLISSDLYAQDRQSKKESRREERKKAEEQQRLIMREMLESRDFSFNATELETSGHAAISNIRLSSLWYVNLEYNTLRCFLPIYGTSPTSQPSILRRLDLTSTSYDYDLEVRDDGRKGYLLTVTTRDTRSNTEYTFIFDIPSNGRNVRLVVRSTFKSPVSFRGDILN